MDAERILIQPRLKFQEYMTRVMAHKDWPSREAQGRLYVTLELMAQLEYFRAMGGLSLLALEKEEIVSVLETFLKQQGLWDETLAWYERLLSWDRERVLRASERPSGLKIGTTKALLVEDDPARQRPPASDDEGPSGS